MADPDSNALRENHAAITPHRRIVLIACLIELAASTAIIAIYGVLKGAGAGQLGNGMYGWGYFKAFTVDSNILVGICALVLLAFLVRGGRAGNASGSARDAQAPPRWAVVLFLMGATGVGLTFATVLVFLAPMQAMMGHDFLRMYSNDMFFFHLVNPIVAMTAIAALIPWHRLSTIDCLVALAPTIAYSAVYTICVVALGIWPDFYGFTFGGHLELAPLSALALYAASFAIALLLKALHNRLAMRAR